MEFSPHEAGDGRPAVEFQCLRCMKTVRICQSCWRNHAIAHAIVDRLVNEAEVFYMEGDSYRPHQRQEKLKRKKQNA